MKVRLNIEDTRIWVKPQSILQCQACEQLQTVEQQINQMIENGNEFFQCIECGEEILVEKEVYAQ